MQITNLAASRRLVAVAALVLSLVATGFASIPGATALQPPTPVKDEPQKEEAGKPGVVTGDEAKSPKVGQPAGQKTATPPNTDIGPLVAKIYRPTDAGLESMEFDFKHQAFENAAYAYRSARFHASYRKPDTWKLTVHDLHEAHKPMAPRLVKIMDWVRHVTCGLAILDEYLVPEKVVRVKETETLTTVFCRGKKGQTPWQLRFREVDGKMRLHTVDSPDFGQVLLRYETIEKIPVVTAIEIDDPKSALGKWTLRCENLKVNP